MKRRTLKDLYDLMGPEEAAKAKALAKKKRESMVLAEVRKQRGFTQAKLAKAVGMSQSALSQMESQDDMQISTLRRIVHALNGRLEVVAHFPDRDIVVVK